MGACMEGEENNYELMTIDQVKKEVTILFQAVHKEVDNAFYDRTKDADYVKDLIKVDKRSRGNQMEYQNGTVKVILF